MSARREAEVADVIVPGEGVEPSRAEAHGFLRPARLPIPPSRPGPTSVPAVTGRSARSRIIVALLAGLGLLPAACTSTPARDDRGSAATIAFLFDGSTGDANLVSGPALAGLELAADQAPGVDIEPLNVGESDTALDDVRALAGDRQVVAAVVGPWTSPPAGASQALAAADLPVVSLSWGWPPDDTTHGISLAAALDDEAEGLLAGAPASGSLCVASDPHPMSRTLTEATMVAGEDVRPLGAVDPDRPETADDVRTRLRSFGCGALLWTGGADAAASLAGASAPGLPLVATSRFKTDEGLALAERWGEVTVTCRCVDVTLTDDPELQRFVHDYQADSGSAPGPFAVEAYDAGVLLIDLVGRGGESRRRVVEALSTLEGFSGIAGGYTRMAGPVFLAAEVTRWRADGSRWLEERPETTT